jgi:hypothetical protein
VFQRPASLDVHPPIQLDPIGYAITGYTGPYSTPPQATMSCLAAWKGPASAEASSPPGRLIAITVLDSARHEREKSLTMSSISTVPTWSPALPYSTSSPVASRDRHSTVECGAFTFSTSNSDHGCAIMGTPFRMSHPTLGRGSRRTESPRAGHVGQLARRGYGS